MGIVAWWRQQRWVSADSALIFFFQYPLVGVGGEVAYLGHRVVSAPIRPEPVTAREEIRLEDRLQHQLQGSLHHPVGDRSDPQAALLAARFRDHPLPQRQRSETTVLERGPQRVEKVLDAALPLDGRRGAPIHPGCSGSPVAAHPIPRHQKERGIGHQVEQVVEPAAGIGAGPLVQLGLDLQYPSLRPVEDGLRIAGIHRRNLLIFHRRPLLTYWTPSPCTELSSARTTTGPPPHPSALGRQRTCPPPNWLSGGRATRGWFPRSPLDHLFREAPSYIPVASPQLRRRPSPWPPARPLQPGARLDHPPPLGTAWSRATDRPLSTRFEPVRALRDFHHWFTCVTPSDLARRTRIVWSCRHVPPLLRLLPAVTVVPWIGLPPASANRCDG